MNSTYNIYDPLNLTASAIILAIIALFVFGYEIAKVIYEFITFVIRLKCYLIFLPYDLAWVPKIPEECHDGIEGAVNFTAIFLALIVAVNLATFSKIYLFYKSTEMDSEEIRIRVKKNKSLFLQTFIQDAIIMADILFTLRLKFIMMMFNERLSLLKKHLFNTSSTPSTVSTATRTRMFAMDS
ncbi:hypothetical protein B9Z55_019056 [Caenorhabditis nigoni]|uniref:7TM GPCR serpentine receptor class x (Srx) domain-containing protein n=1 Tax=Caenorhabditis nigoni TaxID=1611254 RepID=A0A2G5TGW1_9PELO|nr:hypothetical protein B9Z55_019056 [Caenorhabditis nigoni]